MHVPGEGIDRLIDRDRLTGRAVATVKRYFILFHTLLLLDFFSDASLASSAHTRTAERATSAFVSLSFPVIVGSLPN